VRIAINLASQPFRKDRPLAVASAACSILLAGLLGLQLYLIFTSRSTVRETRAEVTRLSGELRSITAEQARLDAVLREPANAVVLQRSYMLNTLVNRKSISWTKIFADLEEVLPRDVRLVQVRLPQIDAQNRVLLDVIVAAQSPGPVIEFLKKLQESSRFGPATVHNSVAPSDNEPLYRYRVSVSYAQRL
jgi:Tfp pilus assembly protein PilN